MKTKTITPPRIEPVSLEQAKSFLKISNNHEDDTLQLMLLSAREMVEEHIGRRLIRQTLCTNLTLHPNKNSTSHYRIMPQGIGVKLPVGPVLRITQIQVRGEQGAQTLDESKISRAEGSNLVVMLTPWVQEVQLTYEVGYGDTAQDIPAPLRQGILILTAQLYENRAKDPDSHTLLANILAPYRLRGVA